MEDKFVMSITKDKEILENIEYRKVEHVYIRGLVSLAIECAMML